MLYRLKQNFAFEHFKLKKKKNELNKFFLHIFNVLSKTRKRVTVLPQLVKVSLNYGKP